MGQIMFGTYLVLLACLAVLSVYGQGCVSPFQMAFGTTDTCYVPVPEGEDGPNYCPQLSAIYGTTRTRYQSTYNICYYVLLLGSGSFPQGCCGGGLPGRR